MEDTKVYTAEFALVKDAKAFAARITEGEFYAQGVVQHGRQVEWEGPNKGEYAFDMLETVGFYGSAPTGRKARLNGITAPASY